LSAAGHPRPVLLSRDGSARFVEGGVGTILGIEPGLAFERVERTLDPGEALVLYTDGVTEAHNPGAELFDDERLLACLAQRPGVSAEAVARRLREAVREFAGEAQQFDDIAILVIRRAEGEAGPARGSGESALEIDGDVAAIPRATEWLHGWCRGHALSEDVMQDLDLALDELLANAIDHGGASGPGAIRLWLRLLGDRVLLEIRERGAAFDPLAAPERGGAAEDGEGGLGLALVGRALDRIDYAREGDENRLVLERVLRR
jgi:sigma-B regulation protein RsbU (phosphoserine phosphatase)